MEETDEEIYTMIVKEMEQSLANTRCERPLKITNNQIQNIIDEIFRNMRHRASEKNRGVDMQFDIEEFNRRFSSNTEFNQIEEVEFESYFYPNTTVIKNKFDIMNQSELEEIEDLVVTNRLTILNLIIKMYLKYGYVDYSMFNIYGEDIDAINDILQFRFDINHLKSIHKFIFNPLYYFAGNIRDVDMSKMYFTMSKGELKGIYTSYTKPRYIKDELNNCFNEYINRNVYPSKMEMSKYLSEFYLNLFRVHSFREGNKRTLREFFKQLVLVKYQDYDLDMITLCEIKEKSNPKDDYEGNEFLKELITSLNFGYITYNFSSLFYNSLSEKENAKRKTLR